MSGLYLTIYEDSQEQIERKQIYKSLSSKGDALVKVIKNRTKTYVRNTYSPAAADANFTSIPTFSL